MKAIKLSMLALALGLMSFTAPSSTGEPFVKSAAAPAIKWTAETIDVGNIPQSKPKTIEFEFKNTGTTNILITNVKPACGCTAADYTKSPIKPGETAKVAAIYNAAAKGAFSKTLTVTTTADATPKVLTFKGTVL